MKPFIPWVHPWVHDASTPHMIKASFPGSKRHADNAGTRAYPPHTHTNWRKSSNSSAGSWKDGRMGGSALPSGGQGPPSQHGHGKGPRPNPVGSIGSAGPIPSQALPAFTATGTGAAQVPSARLPAERGAGQYSGTHPRPVTAPASDCRHTATLSALLLAAHPLATSGGHANPSAPPASAERPADCTTMALALPSATCCCYPANGLA
jgi:hypothetical protein